MAALAPTNTAHDPRTAVYQIGRDHHHAVLSRRGAGTPGIATTATHNESALRCQAYTAIAAEPARFHSARKREPTRSSARAAIIKTPTCASPTTAV